MILKECFWSNIKGYTKIGFCGFGISDSESMSKKKENLFINGKPSISVIPISYLQWLYRIKNREKIGRGERLFWIKNILIRLIIMLPGDFLNFNSQG